MVLIDEGSVDREPSSLAHIVIIGIRPKKKKNPFQLRGTMLANVHSIPKGLSLPPPLLLEVTKKHHDVGSPFWEAPTDTVNNDSVYFHYLFSQGKSPHPRLSLCVCVFKKKITVGIVQNRMSMTWIWAIRELIQDETEDTAWSVYHTVQGKEGRRDRKMEQSPSAGRWASHASSIPLPERQRRLCYPVFWPQQETPDPSLKA